MFGIGLVEVFLILVVALLVIGPDRIPEAATALGKAVRSARQFINELKGSVHDHPHQPQDLFAKPHLTDADESSERKL
jgi:Tat protein translocase TatB subunit